MAPNAELGSKIRIDGVEDFNPKYINEETELLKGVDGDGLLGGGEIFGHVSGSAGPS